MPIDTRVSLQKLEVFEAVVELGAVTAAANHLGVAQPVVSAHLRSLERRVGTGLFYREGRRLHLTEAGRVVHGWAMDLLRRTRELSRDLDSVSDGRAGTVVIGTSMSLGSYRLVPVLRDFLHARPGVNLRVDVLDAAHAITGTETGDNDFSLVAIQSPSETQGLVIEQIGTEKLVLVAAPTGPPAHDHVTVSELTRLPFVEAQRGSLRRTFTDRELSRIGLHNRRVVIELGHPEPMKQMTAAGLGVCWLFRSAVGAELGDKRLRELNVEGVDIHVPVYLVHRKDKFFSTVHRDLLHAVRDSFQVGDPRPGPLSTSPPL